MIDIRSEYPRDPLFVSADGEKRICEKEQASCGYTYDSRVYLSSKSRSSVHHIRSRNIARLCLHFRNK